MAEEDEERHSEGGGCRARKGDGESPGGRMAIGTSLGGLDNARAIANSVGNRLITCGHEWSQGLTPSGSTELQGGATR